MIVVKIRVKIYVESLPLRFVHRKTPGASSISAGLWLIHISGAFLFKSNNQNLTSRIHGSSHTVIRR